MAGRGRGKAETQDIRVGEWRVEALLATGRIEGVGPAEAVDECGGHCCLHGVYISLAERDRILEYADRVRQSMDETQTPDVEEWFEEDVHEDSDFPGERCVGTAVYNNKCAFLDRDGLCVLQKLEPDLALPEGERLKPFYCRLFPLTTWYGRLEFDPLCDGVRPCCTMASDGGTPAVEAYAYELTEALGEAGYAELRRAADRRAGEEDGRPTEGGGALGGGDHL